MEPVLAIFHYLMIFSTIALLVGEFVLLRLEATGPGVKLLSVLDLLYGIFALLLVASGLLRVFLGTVSPDVWGANQAFWAKMGLFLVIGVLSVIPTLRFMGWKKAYLADGTLPDAAARKAVSLFVHLQLGLFLFIPILAVVMVETL